MRHLDTPAKLLLFVAVEMIVFLAFGLVLIRLMEKALFG